MAPELVKEGVMPVKQWRLAKSLGVLREQINVLSPNRLKISDGTIGNPEHAAKTSDHNPWIRIMEDGKQMGIVTGLDITNDPRHGIASREVAEALIESQDPRIKYVIADGEIAAGTQGPSAWKWRKYKGENSHHHHVHISVHSSKADFDDDSPWILNIETEEDEQDRPPSPPTNPVLARGNKGPSVKRLQQALNAHGHTGKLEIDEDFGPKTEAAVKDLQRAHHLKVDGIVGPYTWEVLLG